MSQPSKGRPTKPHKQGDAMTGVSVKQGVDTAAGASEVKAKAGKVDASKPASLASKHSTKPGVTAQKTTDPSKGKQTPKMEPGSKTNPAAKQATNSSSSSGAKPKDTALGKPTTTASSIKSSGTTGEKQSHSPAAGSQKGKMVPGKTSDTSKDIKQSRNLHAANGNSVRVKEEIHQKHLEDVMKIVADMKSQIMSEVSLMIGEEINSLKGTIIKSLESTSMDQKGAVIASLKNASVMEPKNQKESANVSSTVSGSAIKSAAQGKTGAHPEAKPKSAAGEVLKDKALADALDFNFTKSDTSIKAPPPSYSHVAASKQKEGKADENRAFDDLSDMLQPEGPVHSGPKYTCPEVKEKTALEKIADKVGEREDSLPPEYRFQSEDIGKKDIGVGAHTHPAEKPKPLKQDDFIVAMASDFTLSSPDLNTKSPTPSSHSAAPVQKKDQIEPMKASGACLVSSSQPAPKGKTGAMGGFDGLSDMLLPEGPVHSGPTYTGPEAKEKTAKEKLAEKVGEREDSKPPDYRFPPEGADKKGPAVVAPTDSGKKPELSKKIDVMDSMASDFIQSSPATITNSAVESSHAAPSLQKKDQIKPVSAPTLCSVSASKPDAKGKTGDVGGLDELSDMLPPEAPVHSHPEYTGPEVKEKSAGKKLADKVGEREDSLPPEYRLYPKETDKKGPEVSAPTDPAKKPKLLTNTGLVDAMASDFVSSSPATITKSTATASNTEPPMLKKDQVEPVKASVACSVSSSTPAPKSKTGDMGAMDALSDMLLPEAPAHSGPEYTGLEVKEKAALEKLAFKVGEREDSLPPNYRFSREVTDKKGPAVAVSTDTAKKPERLTDVDFMDAMASDFAQSSPAIITQSAAASSHVAPPKQTKDTNKKGPDATVSTDAAKKPEIDLVGAMTSDFMQRSPAIITKSTKASSHAAPPMPTKDQIEPVKASTACSVSASQPAPKGKVGDTGAFDILSDMLQPEAPAHSVPKYTGPKVEEKAAHEKLADKVGEREDSLPPDYRLNPEGTEKKGSAVGAPTDPVKKPEMPEAQLMDAMSLDFAQNTETLMAKSQTGGTKPKKGTEKKGSAVGAPTDPVKKPELLAKDDLLSAMASDFIQSSPSTITKSAAPPSHSAAPVLKKDQSELVKATAASSVSASQSAAQGKIGDMGALDELSDMLQPEAPDNSGPKYTGREVKETTAHEKLANKVGEREDSLPPDYQLKPEGTDKKGPVAGAAIESTKKSKMPEAQLMDAMSLDFAQNTETLMAKSQTGGTKPKKGTEKKGSAVDAPTDPVKKPELLAKDDLLSAMASDFIQSSPTTITKSAAPPSHSAAPVLKKDQSELVKATAASSVSASQSAAQGKIGDMGALDELSDMLQPEAPDNSGPKYTGREVKETTAHEKLANKVGEREDSLPPDYQLKPEGTDKKGPVAGAAIESTKKSKMPEAQLMDAMSLDFAQNTETLMAKSQTGGTKPKKVDNKPGDKSIEISPTLPTSPTSPKSPTSPTSPTKAKDTASKSGKAKEHASTKSGSKKSRKR